MRWTAGPERTPCVAQATTLFAPLSASARAAPASVPAVSIMSSMMMQSLPFTSPMRCITSLTLARSRRLSMMASDAFEALAIGARALHAAGVGRDEDRGRVELFSR